jgi:hypothetical protein
MAYINQETKANIVNAVKPILKKYGVKASFAVNNHSTFVVNIKSGVLDFIGNHNANQNSKIEQHYAKDSLNVNQYWLKDNYSGEVLDFLVELYTAIKTAGNWFDKSDAQTDYFHTAYYFDVNVGRWNKPYELTV